ncbi:hypothetical protein F5Y19DRAFT_487754 [Xylariaceae sp. FL1651]|nr:hypothetical protein F5Y19DRAFT_487754 [Xylariaceae sp. FL1651]
MDLINNVYNHLVLPPQLPGAQDPDLDAISQDILSRMKRACKLAEAFANSNSIAEAYQSLHSSLNACSQLNTGCLDQSKLLDYFRMLHPGLMLVLYVNEQNAALLIRQDTYNGKQCVIFESFEASATVEHVLAAGHAMQWEFPGRSAQISVEDFSDRSFLESLSNFLQQASAESLYSLQASSRKAGVVVTEIRDTTDPALISQMLMSLLEAKGSYYQAPSLRKRVRDDVNLGDADLPWRRLPFWLVLRVAAQRHFCLALGNEQGQLCYKVLMSILLAKLLDDTLQQLNPHLISRLQAKIVRRMAKMEMMRQDFKVKEASELNDWLDKVSCLVRTSAERAGKSLDASWQSFKDATTRTILPLPRYIDRSYPEALRLQLNNSWQYISNVLSCKPPHEAAIGAVSLPNPLDKAVQQSQDFTDSVFRIAALEKEIDNLYNAMDAENAYESYCIYLAEKIDEVFATVGSLYDSQPEQMSAMVLNIFSLWAILDKCAIGVCPLLRDHRPVFEPELLDALQLPTLLAMRRLQQIQTYLAQRCRESSYSNILDMDNPTCLAVRYVGQSDAMQSLTSQIQAASDQKCELKKYELEGLSEEYDKHTKGYASCICCCTYVDGKREVKGCEKCWHLRAQKRLAIGIHEEYLPRQDPARSALVFELAIPSYLSAYRDATWRLLITLVHPFRSSTPKLPEIHVQDCGPLQEFLEADINRLSLASSIKCFRQTHYRFDRGKVPLNRIILPLAADFRLYDQVSKTWVEEMCRPLTLQHICGVYIPQPLRSTIVPTDHPQAVVDGPSSYEIQVNQTLCPRDMSVHEFSAYQKLLAGKLRRWPNILVELSSSNLNLSHEDTARVICQLAHQAGPQLGSQELRATHVIFEDPLFNEQLTEVLGKMLRSIEPNWREHNCMELIITLILRQFSLSCGSAKDRAAVLLDTARQTTLHWIDRLQNEIHKAGGADSVQRIAGYRFHAALLCRMTFAVYINSGLSLDVKGMESWVQAALAFQDSALHDIHEISHILKGMLIRDARMAYDMQPYIKIAMMANRATVGTAVSHILDGTRHGANKALLSWSFMPDPWNRWIVARTSEPYSQRIHFNYIEGHLLVNGKPPGKLPLQIRNDESVKNMFGNQHLLTVPSFLPGMSHRLLTLFHHQQVHFGLRDGRVIIRTGDKSLNWRAQQLLEFIPGYVFRNSDDFDLPDELVENCAHWLNLTTKCLEIRRALPQSPNFWRTRERDWVLDFSERRASRIHSILVDPYSSIFRRVAGIFDHFEQADKLTVYQPQSGPLCVELKRMDLSFFVNQNQMLECRQLNAEIDLDQDAGVWYGLSSKLVLRDIKTGKRSIIVPLGEPMTRKNSFHVDVHIVCDAMYGRYMIDDVLGRLSCAPDPRLVYGKALLHAMTSFCLPDTLTGRTGAEEAAAILQSGVAQPWIPLAGTAQSILTTFNRLVPRREYYPPSLQRLQKVTWDTTMTTTIQQDYYRPLINALRERSSQLAAFGAADRMETLRPTHLCSRGELQRCLYERRVWDTTKQIAKDYTYTPRDRQWGSEALNVYHITRVLLSDCVKFHMHSKLKAIFETSEVIGGFHDSEGSLSHEPLISQIEEPIFGKWGDLVNACRQTDTKAGILFRLGLLAFNEEVSMDLVHTLAAFACVKKLKQMKTPTQECFVDFKSRGQPTVEVIKELFGAAYYEFDPVINHRSPVMRDSAGRDASEYEQLCQERGTQLATMIVNQWPAPADNLCDEEGNLMSDVYDKVVDIDIVLENVTPEWERRRNNSILAAWANAVQRVLNSLQSSVDISTPSTWQQEKPTFMRWKRTRPIPSVANEMVVKYGPYLQAPSMIPICVDKDLSQPGQTSQCSPDRLPEEMLELDKILEQFVTSDNSLRMQYGIDLQKSLQCLKAVYQKGQLDTKLHIVEVERILNSALRECRLKMRHDFDQILKTFASNDDRFSWLELGFLQPCTTRVEVLELLRSTLSHRFGTRMKEALVTFALVTSNLQRLERIRASLLRKDQRALHEELRNPGHENWDPLQYSDWLLLEIDCNILIRQQQVDVAKAIISPRSRINSVLQMNMGQGKTSCIVPMAIASLADGKNLSRLIVPKALLMQTAQTLQSRLGGLVGRELCHIPFSRKTSTELETLDLYVSLHQEIQQKHGFILTCHEHLLSYKLSGWQKLADEKQLPAEKMLGFQLWLDKHSRDILDECDFTLSVKTQLNYPSGREMTVDGHPFRWQVAEGLLALVALHIRQLSMKFPSSIEVRQRPGWFPMVHFLRVDAEEALHKLIIDDICGGRTTLLRLADSGTESNKAAARQVLEGGSFDHKILKQAIAAFDHPQTAAKILLLLRGITSNRILLLCLSKRWNVQYGLHPDRHPVAVPFEAKGKPSEQAEYGHPDVAILFTCLSFYYSGLTYKQFIQGLQNILQSEDPATLYQGWISGSSRLPEALCHWNVLNTDDEGQMQDLWTYLKWDRIVVDYYLNNFVFPAHAKQFELKLQASGWDIPLFFEGKQFSARTTGFSGTNDNRMMLPLTIKQHDLEQLQHTSAEVLCSLLQSRNRTFHVTTGHDLKRLTEEGLLETLANRKTRVLIDVGAYVLEMDNRTLAVKWLKYDGTAKAAVYFGNDNRAWVKFRSDAKSDAQLLATSFADDLSECVVYLDEAHTRGVDLKLPVNAHGALTLALKQTKDYTVQAAMRLRQLNTTQSVSFYAPPEVDQSIRDFCNISKSGHVNSSHVVSWLLEQTCRTNEDLQNLYVAQGLDFCRRIDAVWHYGDFMTSDNQKTKLLGVLRQQERQTLEQMYGLTASSHTNTVDQLYSPQLQNFADRLAKQTITRHGIYANALGEVEQEREVEVQFEQIRQVQRPIKYDALLFPGLHPTIRHFIRTGVLRHRSLPNNVMPGVEHAFAWVARTRIGRHYGVRETESLLFMSKEFGRTLDLKSGYGTAVADNFLRPVEWILWSPAAQTAIVIIPEEAELVIKWFQDEKQGRLHRNQPDARSRQPPVHLIAYAAPVTKAMIHFNNLRFYAFPELPQDESFPDDIKVELGILSGRLYIDMNESELLNQYLKGLKVDGSNISVQMSDNLAGFLLDWLTLRRKTVDVMHTHMGLICSGRELNEYKSSDEPISEG